MNEHKKFEIDLGFLKPLGLVLVILKLAGVISWSWFWVLLPWIIIFAFWILTGILLWLMISSGRVTIKRNKELE